MPEQIPRRMSVEITQKWRNLAEKRRAHLFELFNSGRWKRYYNEEQITARAREASRLVETWDELVTPPGATKPAATE